MRIAPVVKPLLGGLLITGSTIAYFRHLSNTAQKIVAEVPGVIKEDKKIESKVDYPSHLTDLEVYKLLAFIILNK